MADAVYTEVLEVSVDSASFVEGLKTLETAYSDFVDRINSQGFGAGNVINVGAFSSIDTNLQMLQEHLAAFDASVTTAFDDVDVRLKQMSRSIRSTGQSVVDAKAEAAKTAVGAGGAGGAGGGIFGTFLSDFKEGFASARGSMGSLLGMVAKFELAWTAVGAVMRVVEGIVEGVVSAIKSGFEYLTQFEQSAARLQGAIAANVTFAKDLGDNFSMAGEAAKQVEGQLEQIAIKTGTPLEKLQSTFLNVVSSLGPGLVKNLGDVVQLTKEFDVAIQASGADVQAQRTLYKEIPQLLQGQVPAHSQILKLLKMSTEQWKEMYTSAQKHGDLAQQLATKLDPYLTVVAQAADRTKNLNESITLLKNRIMGAIELSLWESWKNILIQIRDFLEEHGNQLVAIGRLVIDWFSSMGRVLGAIINLIMPTRDWLNLLKLIGASIVASLVATNDMFDALAAGIKILAELLHTALDPKMILHPVDEWETAFAHIGEITRRTGKQMGQNLKDGLEVFLSKGSPNWGDTLLNAPFTGGTISDNTAKIKEQFEKLKEDYTSALQAIKNNYTQVQDSIKNAVATGNITFKQGTDARIAALKAEKDAVDALAVKYSNLAAKSGAQPVAIDKFQAQIHKSTSGVDASSQKGTKDAIAAQQKEVEALSQQHYKAEEAMELAHYRAMLAIYKEEAAAGLHTKLQVFDQEQALAEKEHAAEVKLIQDELNAGGLGDQKRQADLDKLTAIDRAYTDKLSLDARTRIQIANQEAQSEQQAANNIARTKIETAAIESKIHNAHIADSAKVKQDAIATAKALDNLAASELREAQAAFLAASANGASAEALQKLAEQAAKAEQAKAQADLNLQTAQDNSSTPFVNQMKQVFQDFNESFTKGNDSFHVNIDNLAGAFEKGAKTLTSAISGAISAVQSGYSSGGVLGAIGGGLSAVGGMIPGPIGSIMSGVGAITSFFGSLFQEEAKHIADSITKAVNKIMQEYSVQQINLVQTIAQVEQQRQDAINELSGKKGGQKQLDTLLPQLDQQIAQLQFQQTQTLLTFNEQLAVLKTQNDTLGSALSTWQQLNDQMKIYVGAGASAADTLAFMSLSLEKLQKTQQDSLNQGEGQAIQDALQLNQLLLQRVNLEKQFAEQQFALANSDAVERMGTPAITAALQLKQMQLDQKNQLQDLDNQISLTTQRVALEKTVFTIASDTAALEKEQNALNITALQEQVQQWQAMKAIIASITENASGIFSINTGVFTPSTKTGPPLPVAPQPQPISVGTMNVNVGAGVDGKAIGGEIYNELYRLGRYGGDTSYA